MYTVFHTLGVYLFTTLVSTNFNLFPSKLETLAASIGLLIKVATGIRPLARGVSAKAAMLYIARRSALSGWYSPRTHPASVIARSSATMLSFRSFVTFPSEFIRFFGVTRIISFISSLLSVSPLRVALFGLYQTTPPLSFLESILCAL